MARKHTLTGHAFWQAISDHVGQMKDNHSTDWAAARDGDFLEVDTSGLSAGDLIDLKALYDKAFNHPHLGVMTSTDWSDLKTLWDQVEP